MSLLYYFYCIYCREKLVTPKHVDMTTVNRLQIFKNDDKWGMNDDKRGEL